MAWDTERTKQLLLDAATEEFSRHGLAGARVDRIASAAGVNKERIYQYFGKKDDLFEIVLERELAGVIGATALMGTGFDAVATYAGRIFDYQREHPALARLVFWEGLELEEPVAEAIRVDGNKLKTERLRTAIPELSEKQAHELLLTIITLCDGWQVLGTTDRVITGEVGRDDDRQAARREFVVAAVVAIARDLVDRAR